MRLLVGLLAAILVLGWLGYELRGWSKDVSSALFGLSALLSIILVVALFFGLYE